MNGYEEMSIMTPSDDELINVLRKRITEQSEEIEKLKHGSMCDCPDHAIQENVRLYIEQEIQRSQKYLHKQLLLEMKHAIDKIDQRLNQFSRELTSLRRRR